jgi:hypothetical protein
MARIAAGNYKRVSPPTSGFRCDSTFYYANGMP